MVNKRSKFAHNHLAVSTKQLLDASAPIVEANPAIVVASGFNGLLKIFENRLQSKLLSEEEANDLISDGDDEEEDGVIVEGGLQSDDEDDEDFEPEKSDEELLEVTDMDDDDDDNNGQGAPGPLNTAPNTPQ